LSSYSFDNEGHSYIRWQLVKSMVIAVIVCWTQTAFTHAEWAHTYSYFQ